MSSGAVLPNSRHTADGSGNYACRRYERIKGKREEEMRIAQQEEELLNLMRAEEEEEASERLALQRKQRAQQTMQAMAEANALQIQYKVSQTSRSAKIRPDVASHMDGSID